LRALFVRFTQGFLTGIGEVADFFAEVFLGLGKLLRVVAHLAHVLGELVGIFFAEIILQLLQLALGARAGGEGLGDRLLLQGFRRALDFGSRLVKLLTFLGHVGLVFGAFHPLAQFVHVREHVLLFVAEALQLLPELLAFLFGFRLLEGGLKFPEPLVEVLLALGQFLEAAGDLKLFALLRGLGGRRLALRLVSIGRCRLKVVNLRWERRPPALPPPAAARVIWYSRAESLSRA
jgi:hypothetical protein